MLALTESAADAIREIVTAPEVPEGAGLRIATQPGSEQAEVLEVMIAAMPAENDQVMDDDGARVFVEAAAAELLDDKLLDARVEGTRVGFTLSDQM